jgi:hypothetical protein
MSDIADCIIGWIAAIGCGFIVVEFIVRVAA